MRHKKNKLSVFQAHLPFKSVAVGRVSAVPLQLERRVLFAVGALLLGLAFLYSYFVMTSVSHVVIREDMQYENEKLSGSVARLEQKYLAASVLLTEASAFSNGFTRISKQTFVERGAYTVNTASR